MDRPFRTFEQQIDKLKFEYNLKIIDHSFAIEALSSISYYDLVNGYQSLYMHNGKYLDGVTIEQLFLTHTYNKNIQNVFMKYSTYIDNSFKTILAYVIAKNYSEHQDEYLKIGNYECGNNHEEIKKMKNFIRKLNNLCMKCNKNPTKHYRETKDHIPPWILFRNMDFIDAIYLFNILKFDDKNELTNYLSIFKNHDLSCEEMSKITFSALEMVRQFRNKIAHNLDFMSFCDSELDKSANKLFIGSMINSNENNLKRNDVWYYILSIIILLNNKYLIHNFLTELSSYLNTGSGLNETYCIFVGIPLDYEVRMKKFINTFLELK